MEPDGILLLRTLTMPCDANPNGDIFGGWIMSKLDEAGALLAFEMCRGKVVTVAVKEIVFKVPVKVGDTVCVYGRCVHIGNTSLGVKVQLWTRRNCAEWSSRAMVTETEITYVAIDDFGKKRPLPKCISDNEKIILEKGFLE
ncbi:MAG: acyl-CoA thioesterase [Succinivibrionaceae bacterium]